MKIPFHKQTTEYNCGPAALQSIFEFFGKYLPQKKLEELLETSEAYGTSHAALKRVATDLGFTCEVMKYSTLKSIRGYLNRGLPVLVNYVEPSDEASHYAVVTRYSNGEITLNDPWNGRDFVMKERDFEARWHNKRNNSKRWLLVVSKE